MLQNSHQFYKWYSELTAVRRQQIEGEYGEYLEALGQRLEVTNSVTGRVDRSISALNRLQTHCTGVCGKVRLFRAQYLLTSRACCGTPSKQAVSGKH